MGVDTVSTHTLKNDATTTIVARTTTIVSERQEIVNDHQQGAHNGIRKTLRDYWFGHDSDENEDEDEDAGYDHNNNNQHDPSLFGTGSVVRRAYDYWKSLTKDADESAKELVIKAKEARDAAAAEAKWAMFGYKREAREAFEAAEQKYKEALAAAERVHAEAHEKARSRWSNAADCTQKEVYQVARDRKVDPDITHQKWDRFKAAVDSFAFNPPKYACSPSSQYWFGLHSQSPDSGWDCREIWDHPSRHDHGHHHALKALPKKHLPVDKVHAVLSGMLHQAGLKAKQAPSSTSFEPSLKSVKDHYHHLLGRIGRSNEETEALEELESFAEKVKSKLNEVKYFEEQTDHWLTTQWNSVVDNAGDVKDQYEKVFKNTLRNIKQSRADVYNHVSNNLQKSVNTARDNIREALRLSKMDQDKVRIQRALQEASQSFSRSLKEAEVNIKKSASNQKNAYENAVETFNKETSQLKAKLEQLAEQAKRSGSSISRQASRSVSSAAHQVTGIRNDAKHKLKDAQKSVESKYQSATDNARQNYEQVTASVNSMWGSATPFANHRHQYHHHHHDHPLGRVHDTYQKALGDVRNLWFGTGGGNEYYDGQQHSHSLYGALLALYLLNLARKIWLRRSAAAALSSFNGGWRLSENGGGLKMTRHHRHSHKGDAADDTAAHGKNRTSDEDEHIEHEHHEHSEHHLRHRHDKHKHQDHEHKKHRRHSSSSNSSGSHAHHHHHHHHHHSHTQTDSFEAILKQFTAIFPVTLALLVVLDMAGFSRVGLHTLFVGLVGSQMLKCGVLNSTLEQLGIVHDSDEDGHGSGREIGQYLSWTVFGLAATANVIKLLHDL
ncbi:hypothetical protein BG004_006573 [Podila humilis]|nr:hypothetical protein BG004_006573 [Podila humilis]